MVTMFNCNKVEKPGNTTGCITSYFTFSATKKNFFFYNPAVYILVLFCGKMNSK